MTDPTEDKWPILWKGVIEVYKQLLEHDYLAERFPIACQDGDSRFAGTDVERASSTILAQTGASVTTEGSPPSQDQFITLVEFLHSVVSAPSGKRWHSFWRHHDYTSFSKPEGQRFFDTQVNTLLTRNGYPIEIQEGRVRRTERLGLELEWVHVQEIVFNTGDADLDRLLEEARKRFADPDPSERQIALEKLWDAFERLKTIDGEGKKESVDNLLSKASSSGDIRRVFEKEMSTLTEFGNNFQVRHHEKGKFAIPKDTDKEYMFYRMFALIWAMLVGTGRGK